MDQNLRAGLTEMIGTFALVLLSAGVVCTGSLPDPSGPYHPYLIGIALTQGFALAALLSATVHISGGYLNPAVTLMLWVFKRLDGRRAAWLIGAQLLGAVLAGLALRAIFSEGVLLVARLGTPHLNTSAIGGAGGPPELPVLLSGIGIELALTFIVTFTIFGTMLDPRGPRLGGLGAGLALSACVFMAYDLTGASANPARWLGPAVWEASIRPPDLVFRDHAVYWIGPILGALLAGGVHTVLIMPSEERTKGEGHRTN